MPLVYRFEDPESGNGRYNTYLRDYSRDSSYNSRLHPTPNEEPGELGKWWNAWSDECKEYFCGFTSKRQLFSWFPKKKLPEMAEETPIEIKVYRVKRKWLKRGVKQVMFHKGNATLIATLKPNSL